MNGQCFKQLNLGAFCSAAIDNWNSSFCICRIQSMVGWCCGPSHVTCFGKRKVSKCDTSRRLNSTCKIEVLLSCTFTNAMRRYSWDRLLAGGRNGSRAEVPVVLVILVKSVLHKWTASWLTDKWMSPGKTRKTTHQIWPKSSGCELANQTLF